MNKLEALIKGQIQTHGPLSLHDYMDMALSHPEFGYYQKSEPFGSSGDFVTAPEISQMFGELIGLWCVDSWVKLGTPNTINLVELGPGRGTLMSDALRSAALAPEFKAAVNIHLVETSDRLIEIQNQHLSGHNIQWHKEFPKLDGGPVLIIANEFFDALPIHQFESRGGEWFEKQVTLKSDDFAMTISSEPWDKNLYDLPDPAQLEDGIIIETSLESREIAAQISASLRKNGGAALLIDYGPMESAFGDSFQAVHKHKYVDPLKNPGKTDLTAHVDFASLEKVAEDNGCTSLPITSQGRFLERLGIEARAILLSKNAAPPQKEKISQDLRRLISAEEMGTLFKALSFYYNMPTPPAGFGE